MKQKWSSFVLSNTSKKMFSALSSSSRNFSSINKLPSLLEQRNIKFEKDVFQKGYRYGKGKAAYILYPKTNEDVSEILKFCNQNKISIVAQGGNTGLVGSSTPDQSGKQIVINTSLLNKDIFILDKENKTVQVGASMIIDNLNDKINIDDLWFPLDFGASGSANIGGIISTNAAGTRAGKYGNVKNLTLEVTSILADGTIKKIKTDHKNKHNNLLQDNTIIDKYNPMIGSQGTLGLITQAKLKLAPIAKQKESAIIVPSSMTKINEILNKLENEYGDEFTACEIIANNALEIVAKHTNSKYLFADDPISKKGFKYALLIEVSSNLSCNDWLEKFYMNIGNLIDSNLVSSGLLGDENLYWHVRHHISDSLGKEGRVIATDISIKEKKDMAEFLEQMTSQLYQKYPDFIISPFGHLMLGAVHYNVVVPNKIISNMQETSYDSLKREVQEKIYDKVVKEFGGSFSAEHNIGPHNQWAYDKYISYQDKYLSEKLKKEYDPNNIMNPNIGYNDKRIQR